MRQQNRLVYAAAGHPSLPRAIERSCLSPRCRVVTVPLFARRTSRPKRAIRAARAQTRTARVFNSSGAMCRLAVVRGCGPRTSGYDRMRSIQETPRVGPRGRQLGHQSQRSHQNVRFGPPFASRWFVLQQPDLFRARRFTRLRGPAGWGSRLSIQRPFLVPSARPLLTILDLDVHLKKASGRQAVRRIGGLEPPGAPHISSGQYSLRGGLVGRPLQSLDDGCSIMYTVGCVSLAPHTTPWSSARNALSG